ncbi:MAG: extracellular solute-binding protein [Paenibacillaceae bacterium]|nr:extracellular solute-binding protein [Paenibacillaceae bacterium]
MAALAVSVAAVSSLPAASPWQPNAEAAGSAAAAVVAPATGATGGADPLVSIRANGYDGYLAAHAGDPRPNEPITIEAESYRRVEGMPAEAVAAFAGSPGLAIRTAESGSIEWEVDVKQGGLYRIGVRYYPVEGKSSAIERELRIDGSLPFREAESLLFPRVWSNEKETIERDNRGNDLRPRQKEAPSWQFAVLQDPEGYFSEPYEFALTPGKHTLTLVSVREPMLVDSIRLFTAGSAPVYEEVKRQYAEQGYARPEDVLVKVQAEAAVAKSSPTLYPLADRASPTTEPSDVSDLRINTIGGYNWRQPGQWIRWEVDVPQDGLYRIAFKSRQTWLRGLYSTRRLTIDGQVPFAEMERIPFYYHANWQMTVLGGKDDPYLFHLTKGKHQLQLEVTLGELAPLLRRVEASTLEINDMYRRIVMITGVNPDKFRDYQLHKQLPDLVDTFRRISGELYAVSAELAKVAGEKSDQTAVIDKMAYQLKDMAGKPDSIPQRLTQYKINVGALGTWMLSAKEQPLDLDYLLVASADAKLPKADASFLRKAAHELSAFFLSFFTDYDSIGNAAEGAHPVTVWIGTGRDQAQVLKAMIDDTFTPLTGIPIDLKLVQMSMLLPATLAGKGPDVAMQVGNDLPVNYAMRDAAYDLSAFPDYPSVAARFRDSANVPYRLGGGVFALPEQQVFNMLFYRKDIFAALHLQPPETWDDVYRLIPALQKKRLDFAFPLEQEENHAVNLVPNDTFSMLLFQSGGSFYNKEMNASALTSETAMKAFKQWTELYTNYKLPLKFNFPNRFRTGEMPIGVADYTLYNNLTVSAPEIRGLWEFLPLPGVRQPDGTIRRETASTGSGTMMLQASEHKDDAWTFMKWWTSKETQVRYGREMEGLMGAAARYPTANIEALEELPWPVKDYTRLSEQWQWVQGVPEVPGGYFTGRQLDNAFREVTNSGTNTREALDDYTRYIDEEIALKRKEFGLAN